MIYEEEKTVDEMVDDILGEDADESEARNAGPADGKRIYLNRCKDCRQTFETPYVGGKYCPACKRRRISAGQKARQARLHGETSNVGSAIGRPAKNDPAASSRQIKPEDEAQRAWDALEETAGGDQTPGSFGPDGHQDDKRKRPEDMTTGELADELADGMRAEPGDVVLALYQAARDVAHRAGIQTRVLIETMYEIDCTLAHIKGV